MGSIQIPPTSQVELASVHFKDEISRKNFAFLNDIDLDYFKTILETNQIVQDPEELEIHNVDCYRMVKGKLSQIIL